MMIRILGAFLALAAFLSATTTQTETITFHEKRPEVGDRRTDRGDMSMDMKMEIAMDGQVLQTIDQEQDEKEELRTTILAMDGDQVTKLELHCVNKVSRQVGPMGELKDESPLIGKTVIATWKDGEIAITDPEGEPVDSDVETAARDEVRGTFEDTSSQFDKVLPKRPIEVGETIEVDPETAREIFSSEDDSPLDEVVMTLTLKGRKEHEGHECGLFAISLTMKGEPNEGVAITASLTGELLLGIENTWPHLMSLAGDMKVSGS